MEDEVTTTDNIIKLTQPRNIRDYISAPHVIQKMHDMLRDDANIRSFTTSLIALASSNKLLADCEPRSLFNAALTAVGMNLPINKSLGFAYIIGYEDHKTGAVLAQFQIGARGFKELAQRSGRYKIIHEGDVKRGELTRFDRLTGEFEWSWIEDEAKRSKTPIIGYFSFFRLDNGFESTLYMTTGELENHALKYSKAYQWDKNPNNKYSPSSLWSTDRPIMSRKTVMKLNISKNGPLDINLQKAVQVDQAIIEDDDDLNYIDGEEALIIEQEAATDEQFKKIVEAYKSR